MNITLDGVIAVILGFIWYFAISYVWIPCVVGVVDSFIKRPMLWTILVTILFGGTGIFYSIYIQKIREVKNDSKRRKTFIGRLNFDSDSIR